MEGTNLTETNLQFENVNFSFLETIGNVPTIFELKFLSNGSQNVIFQPMNIKNVVCKQFSESAVDIC